MNIDHMSVSRHRLWEECRQKYKFRYHLKVPPPRPDPPYFLYGKLVHKIAEEYVKGEGEKDINEIRRQCLDGVILLEDLAEGEKPPKPPIELLPKSYTSKLTKHLRSVLLLTKKFGFGGICEWGFEYDLDPPNNRCVYGFIDRIVESKGKHWIIDYKTTKKSRWCKTQKDVDEDLQLQCYTMVVHEKLGVDVKDIVAGLMYVDYNHFVGTPFTEEVLEQTKKQLLVTYKEIELANADNVHAWVGRQCERCEYNEICPFLCNRFSK